jgi:putrescine transport system permease protein
MSKFYSWFGRGWLTLGYLFLYIPIIVLIVYSFNDSAQNMIWQGFTLQWYKDLADDTEIISGFILSFKIAALAATCSVVLGTSVAYVLNYYRQFRGRALFKGMASAPLVMPEVIIGLSLLLLLIGMEDLFGFPQRGLATLVFGHTVLGVAYAAIVIESRLKEINSSLSEAAMDLGCKPYQVFGLVTLPNLSQALMSSWLLTFTLSLDDVVISSFLTSPGYSTMPIIIFSRARLGLDPRVNAIAALTILAVTLVVVLSSLHMARKERLRQKAISTAFKN